MSKLRQNQGFDIDKLRRLAEKIKQYTAEEKKRNDTNGNSAARETEQ